jgi:hypothetical protein
LFIKNTPSFIDKINSLELKEFFILLTVSLDIEVEHNSGSQSID